MEADPVDEHVDHVLLKLETRLSDHVSLRCDWDNPLVLKAEHLAKVKAAVSVRPEVTHISLQGHKLQNAEAVKELSEIVRGRRIQQVDLSYCRLGEAAPDIIESICDSRNVTWLDCTFCHIGISSVPRLARALANPMCELRVISLRYNPITAAGLGLILRCNTSLVTIDCRCCGILADQDPATRVIGMAFIAEGLRSNNSCSCLLLQGNGFTKEDERTMYAEVSSNKNSCLSQSSMIISDPESDAVLRGLTGLRGVVARKNEEGAKAVVETFLTFEGEAHGVLPTITYSTEDDDIQLADVTQLEQPPQHSPPLAPESPSMDLDRRDTLPLGFNASVSSRSSSMSLTRLSLTASLIRGRRRTFTSGTSVTPGVVRKIGITSRESWKDRLAMIDEEMALERSDTLPQELLRNFGSFSSVTLSRVDSASLSHRTLSGSAWGVRKSLSVPSTARSDRTSTASPVISDGDPEGEGDDPQLFAPGSVLENTKPAPSTSSSSSTAPTIPALKLKCGTDDAALLAQQAMVNMMSSAESIGNDSLDDIRYLVRNGSLVSTPATVPSKSPPSAASPAVAPAEVPSLTVTSVERPPPSARRKSTGMLSPPHRSSRKAGGDPDPSEQKEAEEKEKEEARREEERREAERKAEEERRKAEEERKAEEKRKAEAEKQAREEREKKEKEKEKDRGRKKSVSPVRKPAPKPAGKTRRSTTPPFANKVKAKVVTKWSPGALSAMAQQKRGASPRAPSPRRLEDPPAIRGRAPSPATVSTSTTEGGMPPSPRGSCPSHSPGLTSLDDRASRQSSPRRERAKSPRRTSSPRPLPGACSAATESSKGKTRRPSHPDITPNEWAANPSLWPERSPCSLKKKPSLPLPTPISRPDPVARPTVSWQSKNRSATTPVPSTTRASKAVTQHTALAALGGRGTDLRSTFLLLQAALVDDACAAIIIGEAAFSGLPHGAGAAQGVPETLRMACGVPSVLARLTWGSPGRVAGLAKLLHMITDPAAQGRPQVHAERVLRKVRTGRLSHDFTAEDLQKEKDEYQEAWGLLRRLRWTMPGLKRCATLPKRAHWKAIKQTMTGRFSCHPLAASSDSEPAWESTSPLGFVRHSSLDLRTTGRYRCD
eukprot:Sspe_Gene.28489::Locus_12968_Transcript_1_3_Confidence_0.500_Length_3538::g.28489::m.28489